ncbi:hypothetical protein HY993_01460 [Candidatus Micrarchaeota archaeon]|nr:hypothetical protein [Candidatus Micrarchaeota archaeon]
MRLKGFALTADALVAIAAAFLIIGAAATVSNYQNTLLQELPLHALARDYPELNYYSLQPITPLAFNQLTGFSITQAAPTPSPASPKNYYSASLSQPSPACPACSDDGLSISCSSSQLSCFGSFDTQISVKRVWVSK